MYLLQITDKPAILCGPFYWPGLLFQFFYKPVQNLHLNSSLGPWKCLCLHIQLEALWNIYLTFKTRILQQMDLFWPYWKLTAVISGLLSLIHCHKTIQTRNGKKKNSKPLLVLVSECKLFILSHSGDSERNRMTQQFSLWNCRGDYKTSAWMRWDRKVYILYHSA